MDIKPISLTDFVDFVISSGLPKLTKVRQIKNRGDYHPNFDFYKSLRDQIIEFHKNGDTEKSNLDKIINNLGDEKKFTRYSEAVRGYKKFLGRKTIEWFDPPRSNWGDEGSIQIIINPELGLIIDGNPTIIKMYFKADGLSKRKIDIILLLMYEEFKKSRPDITYGVLDVPNGKLYSNPRPDSDIKPLLIGEAQNFKTVWENL